MLARVMGDRVLLTFDLETCAAPGGDARDPSRARIVEVGFAAFSLAPLPGVGGEPFHIEPSDPPIGYVHVDETYIDPQIKIDAGSQSKHHITDTMVRGAPTFADLADDLAAWLMLDDGRETVLCAYNGVRYDVQVLAAEFRRVGRNDLAERVEALRIIDPLLVRRAAEQPFTLEGSLRHYGLESLGDAAHRAGADSLAALAVVAAQAGRGEVASLDAAAGLAKPAAPPPGAVDRSGKLRWVNDRAPEPATPTPHNVRLAVGKHKDRTLAEAGADYCRWLVTRSDFADDVKAAVRAAYGAAAARW